MVHVRVDEQLKTQATETLAAMRAAMEEARALGKARFATANERVHDLEEGGKP